MVLLVDAGSASAGELDRTLHVVRRAAQRSLRVTVHLPDGAPDAVTQVLARHRREDARVTGPARARHPLRVVPGEPPAPDVLLRLVRLSPDVAGGLVSARHASQEPFGRMPNPVGELAAWTRSVAAAAPPAGAEGPAVRRWAVLVLRHDAVRFLDAAERLDDLGWSSLRAALGHLADHLGRLDAAAGTAVEGWPAVPHLTRVKVWLAVADRRHDLERLVVASRFDDEQVDTRVDGQVVVAETHRHQPGLEDLPESLWHLHEDETPLRAVLRRARWDGDVLELELLARAAHVPTTSPSDRWRVTLRSGRRGVELPVVVTADPAVDRWAGERCTGHDRGVLGVRVEGADLPVGGAPAVVWVELLTGRLRRTGTVQEVDPTGSFPFLGPGRVGDTVVELLHDGTEGLRLVRRPTRDGEDATTGAAAGRVPVVVEVVVEPGQVVLRLDPGPGRESRDRWTFGWEGPRQALACDVAVDGDRLVVRCPTTVVRWGRPQPAPLGSYRLVARRDGVDQRLGIGAAVVARLPEVVLTEDHRVRLGARDGVLRLGLGAPLGDDEVGPRAQQLIRESVSLADREVDPRLVYLQSYTGQSATDSPLAVHHELRRRRPDLRLVWAVADRAALVPEDAETVLWRSRRWHATLAAAGCIVTNIELEPWFEPRPRQLVVQTFHGYPSKSMGIRLWRSKDFTASRIEQQLDRTSRKWGLLVTPSPEMDRYYREEYRYDGEIAAVGYPRDDLLVSDDAPATRQRTRRLLGVADHQRLVLYAPTWRDDLATNHRAARMQTHLDVDRLAAALGPGYVVALRGHRFHTARAGSVAGSAVVDVTDHPEINDLVLACDAAVLDYSSLRFEMALAGRPMVFLVPDLEDYTGSTRGFLFDFRESAPGPLVRTTDEVAEALLDLDGLTRDHAAEVGAFDARFHRFNDGRAAERLVERVLGMLDERHRG